jgi:hypothetical protein
MFMRYSGEGVGHRNIHHTLGTALLDNSARLHYKVDELEWVEEDDMIVVPGGDNEGDAADSDWEYEVVSDLDDEIDNVNDIL